MALALSVLLLLSSLVALSGFYVLFASMRVGAGHSVAVVSALLDEEDSASTAEQSLTTIADNRAPILSERIRFCVLGAAVGLVGQVALLKASIVGIAVAGCVGACAGELYRSRRNENRAKHRLKRMEFYLPTVMERIVMGVSTGLDIVPALREASTKSHDPVSELLRWVVDLSEGGIPVEAAIEAASKRAECMSVKHALIHVGLAHRQGGEIVRPLKELSDATQVAYQELVDEQIARLPVKAIIPLLITFTGLIVSFLTIPLMQVSSMTKTVTHGVR